jgi:hypothetical protein
LPDVRTGRAVHRNLIRCENSPSRRGNCVKTAFKAPSLRISPLLVVVFAKGNAPALA